MNGREDGRGLGPARVEACRPLDLALVAGMVVIAAVTVFVTLSISCLAVGAGS